MPEPLPTDETSCPHAKEVARLKDIIRRAQVEFFHDGSDGEAASRMLAVLLHADHPVSTQSPSSPK